MADRPAQGKILGWTAVWLVLLLLANLADLDRFASWLDEPVWIAWILVGFYLLWLTYRWFAAPRPRG